MPNNHDDGGVVESLREQYPGAWSACLIRICGTEPHAHPTQNREEPCGSPGKRPLGSAWNREAARILGEWTDATSEEREKLVATHLERIAHHLATGGNVGLALPDGVLVIDLDDADSCRLAGDVDELAAAPCQRTAKGLHFVVRAPAESSEWPQQTKIPLANGMTIDLRLPTKGQIVCAPSIHAGGIQYEWLRELPASRSDLPRLSPEMVAMIEAGIRDLRKKQAGDAPRRDGARVREGGRNAFLTSRAGVLFNAGLAGDALFNALCEINQNECDPPLSESEVRSIENSATRTFERAEKEEQTEDPWEEPEEFRLPSAVEFPERALPPVLRDFCTAAATSVGIPVAMAATPVIGVLAFAASRIGELEIAPTRVEGMNLYTLIVAPKGSGKTPAIEFAAEPFLTWAEWYASTYGPHYASQEELLKQQRGAVEADAKKAVRDFEGPERLEAQRRIAREMGELAVVREPKLPDWHSSDFTEAKLGTMLEACFERGLVLNDEGSVLFDNMAGRNSKGVPEMSTIASCWNGGTAKIDRISRSTIRLRAPRLSIVSGIQPELLRRSAKETRFRDQGILDRFVYCFAEAADEDFETTPIPAKVADAYAKMVDALLRTPDPLEPQMHGRIKFSSEASEERRRFHEWTSARIAQYDGAPAILEAVKKLRRNAIRLAGILHCVENWRGGILQKPVSGETFKSAAEIGMFWFSQITHLHHLYGLSDAAQRAAVVLRAIERLVSPGGDPGGLVRDGVVNRRELHRRCHGTSSGWIHSIEDTADALRFLEKRGFVRCRRSGKSEVVAINPAVFLRADAHMGKTSDSSDEPDDFPAENVQAAPDFGQSSDLSEVFGESEAQSAPQTAGSLIDEWLEVEPF